MSWQELAYANTSDKAQLKELIQNWTLAINNKDFTALADLFTDDLQIINADHQIITSKKALLTHLEEMLTDETATYKKFHIDTEIFKKINFLSDNIVVMSGVINGEFTLAENDKEFQVQKYWTATLIKNDGKWKFASLHSSVNNADKYAIDAKPITPTLSLIFAASIGFLIGALVTAMMRNKQV
jgi:uncharacterized protein (TIGR02246 family)